MLLSVVLFAGKRSSPECRLNMCYMIGFSKFVEFYKELYVSESSWNGFVIITASLK